MTIRNNVDEDIVVAGIGLKPGEERLLSEIGTQSTLQRYASEIIDFFTNEVVKILYSDGSELTDIYRLTKYLTGDIIDVEISNLEDLEEIFTLPENQKTNDYYYNNYPLTLKKGQTVDLEFKGYMKSATLRVYSGEVTAQIISEPMNKVTIEEQNVFEIDTDNKLLDPVIRVKAEVNSEAELFVDGSYFDKTGTKTKEQYLEEIYNRSTLPEPPEPEVRGLNFSIDFRNQDLVSGEIIENFSNQYGSSKGFSEENDPLWNRYTDVEFKSALGVQIDKEFTHSIFFKPYSGARWTQYFMLNGQFKIYIATNGRIYVWYMGRGSYIGYCTFDKWNHLVITYDKEKINVYLNSNFSYSLTGTFRNYPLGKLSIGNYSFTNAKYGFIGEIGLITAYNYFFSQGMVYHLYKTRHPNNDIETNLLEYCNNTFFSIKDLKPTELTQKVHFDILEKEYRKPKNILFNEKTDKIDFGDSRFWSSDLANYFMVSEGIFKTVEEAYYNFKIEVNQYGIVIIDDRLVAITSENNGEGSIFLNEGYHNFKYLTVSFNTNSYWYCKIFDEDIQDWVNFNLFQKDIEDTEAQEEDKSIQILVDSNNIIGGTLDHNDSEIIEYDNFKSLQFKDSNGLLVKDLGSLMSSNIFSVSMVVKFNKDRECYVFSMGGEEEDWQIWLSLRFVNRSLELNFQDSRLNSDKIELDKWYQIDIISDGTNIELVLNSNHSTKNIMKIHDNDWFEGSNLYFNRLPNGKTYIWMQSDYEIGYFKYYNNLKNKKDIETNLYDNSKIFDFSYVFSK